MKINKIILSVLSFVLLLSCSNKNMMYTNNLAFKSEDGIPHYDQLEYWAAHPLKVDLSDTLTKSLQKKEYQGVDVFFVHPTTFTGDNELRLTNARIDDSMVNYKTDHTSILYQASVFNENNRVFAPRYRQAHISMYQIKDTIKQREIFDVAYQDVKKAFEFYLNNDNQNRPFIIASHSQGTNHCERLIAELIDGTPLQDKIVCAYLLGMPIKKNRFKNIKACANGRETGCVISWRTFDEKYQGTWVNKVDTNVIVTNPLSWETNNRLVEKESALGAILYNMNKIYKVTHHAQILGNALWINKPKFPGSFLYRNKNYHAGDINLFYENIRRNVEQRIEAYYADKNHHVK